MSTAPDSAALPALNRDIVGGQHFGLTAREHAAIALRVPDSGNDWLDAMIRTAQRNDYAGQALAALIGREHKEDHKRGAKGVPLMAEYAFEYADAMLSASAVHSAEGE